MVYKTKGLEMKNQTKDLANQAWKTKTMILVLKSKA
jgi:hypothetical protein